MTTATAATSPASGQFSIKNYLVTLTKPGATAPEPSYAALSNTSTIDATTWSVPADWVGTAVLTIYTVDIIGNQSVVSTTNITKVRPNAPSSASFTVNDAQLLVDWADVATATNGLPVAGYEIRKTNMFARKYYRILDEVDRITVEIHELEKRKSEIFNLNN